MPRRGLPLAQAQFFSPARYPPHAAARNATAIGKNSGLCIPAHGGEVTQHFEHFFGGLRLQLHHVPRPIHDYGRKLQQVTFLVDSRFEIMHLACATSVNGPQNLLDLRVSKHVLPQQMVLIRASVGKVALTK